MSLSRDEILKAKTMKIEKVEAWGGTVCVRGMTGAERDQFEAGIIRQRGKEQTVDLRNVRAKLCAMTLCDEDGNRLVKDEDVTLLANDPAVELQKVFVVAQRLSGITAEDVEELTEDLKNPFEGSSSD